MSLGRLTEEMKDAIRGMTQLERCRLWQSAPMDHPYFRWDLGEFFERILLENGGFTPAINKQLEQEKQRDN